MEKALIRLDPELRYQGSQLFQPNVGHIAHVPGSREIIAIAEDDRWYRCSLPPRNDF